MGLPPAERLDIAELVFYALGLVFAVLACAKHGLSGGSGFLYLVLLSLDRIVSGATGIASYHDTSNTSLAEASIITANIGISFLIFACLELMKRINLTITQSYRVPPLFFRAIVPPLIVGVVLTIVGATKEFSSPSDRSSGETFLEAGIALIAAVYFLYLGGALWTWSKIKHINRLERTFLFACLAAAPFLFVRILYALIAVSNPGSTKFSIFQPDIVVEACMATLEEFIVVIILLAAALLAPNDTGSGYDNRYRQTGANTRAPNQV